MIIKTFNNQFFLNKIRILCYNDYELFEYFYNHYNYNKIQSIELSQMEISIIDNFLDFIKNNDYRNSFNLKYQFDLKKKEREIYENEIRTNETTYNYYCKNPQYYQYYQYCIYLNETIKFYKNKLYDLSILTYIPPSDNNQIFNIILESDFNNIKLKIRNYLNDVINTITIYNYYYLLLLFSIVVINKPNNIYKCNPELNKLIDKYEKEIQITRIKYQGTQRDSAAVSRGGRRKKKVLKKYK